MEGLKVSDANLVVHVHPSKANKVPQAILRELSSLLFKFSEVFDGVVLAYDVTVRNESAVILPGIHPYFGVRLKAKMLLFSPKPDMLLEGKVVKLGQESIHVIVLGFSSAVITEEDIREEFRYKVKHGEEVYASTSHKRHVIKVGSMVRFMVKSLDEEILHISGSLIPSNTGNIHWLNKHMEEGPQSERSIKRKERDMQENDHRLFDEGAFLSKDRHHKKSKKRRTREED